MRYWINRRSVVVMPPARNDCIGPCIPLCFATAGADAERAVDAAGGWAAEASGLGGPAVAAVAFDLVVGGLALAVDFAFGAGGAFYEADALGCAPFVEEGEEFVEGCELGGGGEVGDGFAGEGGLGWG